MTKLQMEELLNTYGDAVFSFCLYLTQNRERAQDLYQETFLKAWEFRNRITYNEEQNLLMARNYVIGIAIRTWKNEKRKLCKQEKEVVADWENRELLENIKSQADVETDVIKKERSKVLHEIVDELPEKLKLTIYLHYTMDMKIEEIAKLCNVPKGTVKSRLHHARMKIVKEMEEHGYGRPL